MQPMLARSIITTLPLELHIGLLLIIRAVARSSNGGGIGGGQHAASDDGGADADLRGRRLHVAAQ